MGDRRYADAGYKHKYFTRDYPALCLVSCCHNFSTALGLASTDCHSRGSRSNTAYIRRVCHSLERRCTPCLRVALGAHDEREVACRALVPAVFSSMSAFDSLLAGSSGSAAPSGSPSTVRGPPGCKAQEQFGDLSTRRENALRDVKGTARWWKFVIRKVVPNSQETVAAELQCILCQTELSTRNHYHRIFQMSTALKSRLAQS